MRALLVIFFLSAAVTTSPPPPPPPQIQGGVRSVICALLLFIYRKKTLSDFACTKPVSVAFRRLLRSVNPASIQPPSPLFSPPEVKGQLEGLGRDKDRALPPQLSHVALLNIT